MRTDASLRTADPDMFAAGDIARYDHPVFGRPIRTEHWDNALHGGTTAALAMLGRTAGHDRLPYFYTDQYEAGMEYIGHNPPGSNAQFILRGDATSGSFMAFWTVDGRILAGMHVNMWNSLDAVERLIKTGDRVRPELLADTDLPIDEAAA